MRFLEWNGGWTSYFIVTKEKRLYFAGDSAYGKHFSEIGKRFEVDIAFLPIGAYRPSFIMKRYHMNPQEAIKAFLEMKAKFFIPIHWGAYRVALEREREPIELLKNLLSTYGIKEKVILLEPGDSLELS